MISCEKEDPVSTSLQLQGKRMTQLLIRQIPIRLILLFVRIMNRRCSCIYPGRTISLLFFYQNIADLKSIIGNNILKNERVIVFICTSATKATLSELVYENGKGVQKTLKNYDYPDPTYTTAEGITSILNDVQTYAPAKRYAMIIGCHGMGWIPVSRAASRNSLQISKSTGSTNMHR